MLKTAGVSERPVWHFQGPARVVESQEDAVHAILSKELQKGEVLVIRYEGPLVVRACRRCCIRLRS